MVIPSHQIHNVLKVYSRQLAQNRYLGRAKEKAPAPESDRIDISAEGKRQMIIDKVAADIVDRITRFGPQNEVDHNIVNKLKEEVGGDVSFARQQETVFVYNVIDDNDEKTTNRLSVEDSSFLVSRLEQLAKEAVDQQMES